MKRLLLALAALAPATSVRAETSVVAVVDGQPVPYVWFEQEFRASYFKHDPAGNVRQEAFDDFLRRMILYAGACRAGITNDPAAMARIESRLAGTRQYLEYQYEMARLGMVIDAWLEKEQIVPPLGSGNMDDTKWYFEKEMAGRGGTPTNFADVPPALLPQLQQRAARARQLQRLEELCEKLRADLAITVDQALVDNVPLPAMGGDVPEPFRQPAP